MADWYVDNTASGSNNGTSWDDAWESFAIITWDSISAGDTVYVSGGVTSKTYHETLSIGAITGTAANRITITAGSREASPDPDHSGTVIIDGDESRSTGIDCQTNGRDYLTISYFTIIEQTGYGVRIENSEGTIIDHITIDNANFQGVRYRYNTGCQITNLHYTSVVSGTRTTDGIFYQDCENTTIAHCYIEVNNTNESTHDDCTQQGAGTTWAGGGTFCYNIGVHTDTDTVDSQGFFWEDAKGTWNIYNNLMLCGQYTKNGLNFKAARDGAVLNIYNNTIIGGSSQAAEIIRIAVYSGSITLNFINNIARSDASVNLISLTGTMVADIDYNILHSGYASAWDSGSYSAWQSRGYDANGTNADPDLNASYKPNDALSPPVGNGTVIGLFNDDLAGLTRGAAWDIGAYEFEEGVPVEGGVTVLAASTVNRAHK